MKSVSVKINWSVYMTASFSQELMRRGRVGRGVRGHYLQGERVKDKLRVE